METPDRRTSFIKSSSTFNGLQSNIHDNRIHETPIRNDNENLPGLSNTISEQDEPTLGKFLASAWS